MTYISLNLFILFWDRHRSRLHTLTSGGRNYAWFMFNEDRKEATQLRRPTASRSLRRHKRNILPPPARSNKFTAVSTLGATTLACIAAQAVSKHSEENC